MVNNKAIQAFKKMIDPVKRSIVSAIARAVIKSIDDTTGIQSAKIAILADLTKDQIEHFQSYGFTSVPKSGAEGVVLFPQGNQDHGILICVDDRRYRFKGLEDGEVALYSDEGDYVHLKRGRIMSVNTDKLEINASTSVSITTNEFSLLAAASASFDTAAFAATAPSATFSHGISAGVGGGSGSGSITTNGSITAEGDIESTSVGTSLNEIKTAYNAHKHQENGTGGGITDGPDTTV